MLRSMAERGTIHAFHESHQGNAKRIGELRCSQSFFSGIFLRSIFFKRCGDEKKTDDITDLFGLLMFKGEHSSESPSKRKKSLVFVVALSVSGMKFDEKSCYTTTRW